MEKLSLSPDYRLYTLAENNVVLFSEFEQDNKTDNLPADLLPLLDGTRDEDQLVDELSDKHPMAEIYYALQTFEKLGALAKNLPSNLTRQQAFEHVITSGKGPASPQSLCAVWYSHAPRDTFAKSLQSPGLPDIQWIDWNESLQPQPGQLWLVFTDAYIDARLDAFNLWALEKSVPWLPVKPSGLRPLIGPLFIPGQSGCFECVMDRFRGHRIIEAYLANEEGSPLPLACGESAASLHLVASTLGFELSRLTTSRLCEALIELDLRRDSKTQWHRYHPRPQCKCCGKWEHPHPFPAEKQLPTEPLQLKSSPKSGYHDGAERIQHAQKTLDRLDKHLDSITGLVGYMNVEHELPEFLGAHVNTTWPRRRFAPASSSNQRVSAAGVSSGKGRTELQAKASGLGESLERYCSQWEGCEPVLTASYTEVKDLAIDPYLILGFSESQYQNREEWCKKCDTTYVPHRFEQDTPIDWTAAWSITEERWKLLPAAYAFYSWGEKESRMFAGDSNGVAAGNCLEEAYMQGFFELAERDAIACWWYNMLQRPDVDFASFKSPFIDKALQGFQSEGFRLFALDLTNDLQIPVFAVLALSERDDLKQDFMMGFGANFDARIALERAVSEIGQSWQISDSLNFDEESLKYTDVPLSQSAFIQPHPDLPARKLSDFKNLSGKDFLDDIHTVRDLLKTKGIELIVHDLTRPDVDLSVVRAIAPGMVHFWPRYGNKRLYQVPVDLGWLSGPTPEEKLNPVPMFI